MEGLIRNHVAITNLAVDVKFKAYCDKLDELVQEAFERAINEDKRLCLKTKKKIFDDFVSNMNELTNEIKRR